MVNKKSFLQYSLCMLSACSLFANEQATDLLKQYVKENTYIEFQNYSKELKTKINALSKNGKGCLINLLDSQFYIFALMEQELAKGNVNQEKAATMMQSFQKVLETFEGQCDSHAKELFEEIQQNIGALIPEEVAIAIQTLQNKLQKMYNTAKEKNQLNTENFQKNAMSLQAELMSTFLSVQTITSLAAIEIYKKAYATIAEKNKECLVRRFDINGMIPLTKRKNNVTTPEKAEALITTFLQQASAMSKQEDATTTN